MVEDIPIPPADKPEEAFAAVVALRRLASSLERSAVDSALSQGWTWVQIGQAIGLTAQAAHKRLAPSKRSPLIEEKR
ncbi:MAG: helix-turn-helix domain-containing protein [Tessaracoccus sp.]|uniref:hypothetical protein n=1 Tax=Tessaracoccus sp. TaxID=1971211 RepID=UPI001EC57C5F|nr:hypothetical protein [Tessaracoccus sp.]MBK7822013.1 helix-turn-helix domain-containing protein [Tessaracoccus sp.]